MRASKIPPAAEDDEEKTGAGGRGRLTADDLRRRFAALTRLLYTTSVPLGVLEREAFPFLGPDIEFVDPWVHTRGREIFRVGAVGFRCNGTAVN